MTTATTARPSPQSVIVAKPPNGDRLVKNTWYIAAWSSEVTDAPLGRRIADEAVAIFRTASGAIAAVEDRCSHRRFPLSRGRCVGENLECGYHGFTFAPDGACVSVPGQTNVPAAARVRSYPIVEKQGVIWLWPGDATRADTATVPDTPWIAEWATITGYAKLQARPMLLVDNLLDLSHETYLHPSSIGSRDVAETPIQVERDGNVLHVKKRMIGAECPPLYRDATGITGLIDRDQNIEFHPPGFYLLHIRVAPTGQEEGGYFVKVIYGITPETATSTHDFWALCRDFALDDTGLSQQLRGIQEFVVDEDVVAVDILEQYVENDRTGRPEVSINIDRGGLVARRMIAEMAAAES